MSAEAARRRLVRALLAAPDARAARAIARAARPGADATTIGALAATFQAELRRGPRRAGAALRALAALAAVTRDPLARAQALATSGLALHAQGFSSRARVPLEAAAREFETAGRLVSAGDTFRVLVDVAKEAGDHAGAQAAFRRAGRLYARAGNVEPARLGSLWMNLGNALHHVDRHDAALKAYERARALLEASADEVRLASCDYNRANILATLDRIDESRALYGAAFAAFARRGLDALVAQCEYALAGLDVLEGRLDAGLARLAAARARHETLGDLPGVAHAELDMADALLRLNRPESAAAAATRARAFFRRRRQVAEVATCDVALGAAALQQGRGAAAAALYRRGAEARRRSGNVVAASIAALGLAAADLERGRTRPAREAALAASRRLETRRLRTSAARGRVIAAQASLRQGDLARAVALARTALRLGRRADPRVAMAAHLVVARAAEARGRGEAAHRELLRAAELVERMRLGVTSEESLLAFALDKVEIFEALVANRLAAGTPEAVREALLAAERGKARLLAERLARGRGAATPATRAARRRLDQLDRELSVAEARLESPGAAGLRSRRESRALQLVAERARLLDDLQKDDPREAMLAGSIDVDPWSGIDALAPGEIALEYAEAEGYFHLFAIDGGRVEAFPRLARVAEVRDLVEMLRFQLGKGVLGEEHAARHAVLLEAASRRRLERLHDLLLSPVDDRLDGRSIRIVPHGLLHGLPFHALEKDGRALIDRALVSHAPSLAVLGLLARPQRAPLAAPLVLGVPDAAAPEIEAEVAALQRHVPGARVFRGAAATSEALKLSEDGPSLLHVACHGFYSEALPSAGALRLGDAWLSLPDLHELRGTGALVVLSGCETGRGTVHSGDEWVGLVRGFLLAGARCVVASSWEVHDRSTATLMENFYSQLENGASVGEALAGAQRAARRAGAGLLHWAPFVVIGDPGLRLPLRRAA